MLNQHKYKSVRSYLLFLLITIVAQCILPTISIANIFVLSLPEEGAVAGKARHSSTNRKPLTTPQPQMSTGTAFFINNTGLLITNYHVIAGTSHQVIIDPQQGYRTPVRIIAVDPKNDLALLQADIQSKGIPIYMGIGEVAKRGEEVLTLGYPSPHVLGVQQKATFGRVNAVTGFADDKRFMQVDLPIQPGNSGGPLLNASGAVIGVVTSRLQGGFQNVNYAVKVGYILLMLPYGTVTNSLMQKDAKLIPMEQIVDRFQNSVVIILAGN